MPFNNQITIWEVDVAEREDLVIFDDYSEFLQFINNNASGPEDAGFSFSVEVKIVSKSWYDKLEEV